MTREEEKVAKKAWELGSRILVGKAHNRATEQGASFLMLPLRHPSRERYAEMTSSSWRICWLTPAFVEPARSQQRRSPATPSAHKTGPPPAGALARRRRLALLGRAGLSRATGQQELCPVRLGCERNCFGAREEAEGGHGRRHGQGEPSRVGGRFRRWVGATTCTVSATYSCACTLPESVLQSARGRGASEGGVSPHLAPDAHPSSCFSCHSSSPECQMLLLGYWMLISMGLADGRSWFGGTDSTSDGHIKPVDGGSTSVVGPTISQDGEPSSSNVFLDRTASSAHLSSRVWKPLLWRR